MAVTGPNGFVGSHVAEALLGKGFRVRALVRPQADLGFLPREPALSVRPTSYRGQDLSDALAGCAAVVHTAGLVAARRPEDFHRVNLDLTARLLEAARASLPKGAPFVFLSSLAARGPAGRDAAPEGPLTAYGRSKAAAEQLLLNQAQGLSLVILRPTAVFGPRDRALLPIFRAAKLGLFAAPAPWDRRLSFCWAEDLAEWCARAVATPPADPVVLDAASVGDLTVSDLHEAFSQALGRRLVGLPVPRRLVLAAGRASGRLARLAGRAPRFDEDKARELSGHDWSVDTEPLERLFGHVPATNLPALLARTYRWYETAGWL